MTNKLNPYESDVFSKSFGGDQIAETLYAKWGQRYVDYREAWDAAGRHVIPEFPLNLVYGLVDACNLACPQCLRAVDIMPKYKDYLGTMRAVSMETMLRTLDEGYQYGLPAVNLGCGDEPTLHPDFIDVCRAVMERDVMELRIVSNGLRLKGDIAEALIDVQATMISISIDGFSAETFAQTRGKGHRYQDVVDNVLGFIERRRKMRSLFPLIRVSFVDQSANTHERDAFLDFWRPRVDMVEIQSFQDYRATSYSTDFDCYEPFRRLVYWWGRHVGPCCGFPGIVYQVGKSEGQSVHEIWHSQEMARFRQKMIDHDYAKPCLQCLGTRLEA